MRDNIYEPFKKVNAKIKNRITLKTIRKANHPMVNIRLNNLSSDIQVFNDRVKPYNEALKTMNLKI